MRTKTITKKIEKKKDVNELAKSILDDIIEETEREGSDKEKPQEESKIRSRQIRYTKLVK